MDKKTSFLKRVRAVLGSQDHKSSCAVIYTRVSTKEQAMDMDEQPDNVTQGTPQT